MKTPILAAALIALSVPALAQTTAPAQRQTAPAQPGAQTPMNQQMPMNQMPMGQMGQSMMQGQGMMPRGMMGGGMMGGFGRGMMGQFSPEDMSAFIDAHIAAIHAGLKLSADQEKLWPPVEEAMRNLARLRVSTMQAMRQSRGMMASDPVGLLRGMADRISQGAEAMRKLADAAAPLYATLDEAQKRRLQVLVRAGGRGMMGRGMMGRGMMGRGMMSPGGAMMPGGSGDDDDDNGDTQDNR